MDKIDRLGWADAFTFKSYGVRVGVRATDARVLRRFMEHLPPGAQLMSLNIVDKLYSLVAAGTAPDGRVRRVNILYSDVVKISQTKDFDELLLAFESDAQLYVGEWAPRKLFVHAGVVGWKGRAIVIPGRSFSGKTTLVKELVRAGATYYSDEYAVLDKQGRVHPFPRALLIREEGTSRYKLPVAKLGGKVGRKPLPVGMIVVSKYKAGARWKPRRLTAGEGAMALLDNMLSARRQPELTLATLQRAVPGATIFQGVRGEAAEVIEAIKQTLSA